MKEKSPALAHYEPLKHEATLPEAVRLLEDWMSEKGNGLVIDGAPSMVGTYGSLDGAYVWALHKADDVLWIDSAQKADKFYPDFIRWCDDRGIIVTVDRARDAFRHAAYCAPAFARDPSIP